MRKDGVYFAFVSSRETVVTRTFNSWHYQKRNNFEKVSEINLDVFAVGI